MESFFGIPINSLMLVLLVIFGLGVAALGISALRNRVMFKMAARNLPRRRANTALTVLGLMLAAMIFSAAFSTGDTLTYSIRSMNVKSLGEVDILVMREGIEPGTIFTGTTDASYFDAKYFTQVEQALADKPEVEGVAPAIIEVVPVVAQSGLNEPAVTLLGLDVEYMEGFDSLLDEQGNTLSLLNLDEGEIYISVDVAEGLNVSTGTKIGVYSSAEATLLTIKGIYESGGSPSGDLSMVMPLSEVQSARSSEDINYILITNRGGTVEGAEHTDTVIDVLELKETGLEAAGLKAEPIKQDALNEADMAGSSFSSIFIVFGSFSIIAGILLIFLIFVMLAAERKRELGIARAVGTQRGHIIRLFTYEGALYALIASAIGCGLGILLGRGMIQIISVAFEDVGGEAGFSLVYNFTTNGLIISYTLGVVLTLVVVVLSARRVGKLNIVRAIRDIPEPQQTKRGGIRGLIISMLLPLIGLVMLFFGIQSKQAAAYMLGGSLAIIGLCLLARRFRLPERAAYTIAGLGLLIFWLIPADYHPGGGEMSGGMEMFVLSGIFMVAGVVWVVMYNSDLLLKAIMTIFGRIRALAPVLKTAISYPMANRFRTGIALAMFSLIIFTLVIMSVISASFGQLLEDTDRISGGFQIIGQVNYSNPIPDIEAALDRPGGVGRDNFQAIASINHAPVKIRQADKEQEWEDLFLAGVDAAYASSISYSFDMMTEEYGSDAQVWQALTDNPSLAVVNAALVPARESDIMEERPDFQIGLGDFYLEDEVLPDDVYIEIQNPFTGGIQKLQVIGVVESMAGPYSSLVTTSQDAINTLAGYPVPPTSYWFQVKPEMVENIPELARSLEEQFPEHGMNTIVMADLIRSMSQLTQMFFNLITAFMGLGLIIGIAALGVIAARSVVERRTQIGVLRALGFQRGMVQFSFILESSFIALLGIGLGIVLGITLSYQLMSDIEMEGLKTVVPWARIGLIVGLAYVFSLLTTFLPAWQASRIYPAEALRSE